MRVRLATLTDLPDLIVMGRQMRAESETRYPPVEPQAIYRNLKNAVDNPDKLLVLLAYDDGGPVGFLSAFISPYSFSDELCAIHDIFFVTPARRGSSAASRLIDGFEAWAREMGASKMMVAVHTGIRPEITARFYGKKGFRHMGGVFDKDLI